VQSLTPLHICAQRVLRLVCVVDFRVRRVRTYNYACDAVGAQMSSLRSEVPGPWSFLVGPAPVVPGLVPA
jgi:hypothetical protein